MELLSQVNLNSYRIYKVSKKINKGIASFPEKIASSYLDYSIDFSRRLQTDERITSGNVIVSGTGLEINGVVANDNYITAFISGGNANNTYYLSFIAQTNLGGELTQDIVLSVTGKQTMKTEEYSFLAFTEKAKPPNKIHPLNAMKINSRYLITESGLFYGV